MKTIDKDKVLAHYKPMAEQLVRESTVRKLYDTLGEDLRENRESFEIGIISQRVMLERVISLKHEFCVKASEILSKK